MQYRGPIEPDEERRLAVLRQYALLDTPPAEALDEITRLASRLLRMPLAAITLLDSDRQCFKSRFGIALEQIDRSASFCQHAIHSPTVTVIPDAASDPRFASNPFVHGEPHIRFYAGAPLLAPGGEALGTLCVMDHRPRQLDAEALETLQVLSHQVMAQFELQVRNQALSSALDKLVEERDEARRGLQERHELRDNLSALFENSLDGVLQTRPSGSVLAANAAACALLGYTPAEIRRRQRHELMDVSDPRLATLLAERQRTGRVRGRVRMTRKGGETFEAEISSSVYTDRRGNPIASAVFRDVTEQSRWERALQDGHALLHNLARYVPGMIYQYQLRPDGQSCFPFASDAMLDIYALAPEQVREDATPVFERLHPDDLAGVSAAIAASAAQQTRWEQEYRVRLPQRGVRWLHGRADPQRLPDGSVLWHGFISDVTERKHAEQRLLRLNRSLRVLGSCHFQLDEIDSEDDYLRRVCDAVVRAGDYVMGWVAYAEAEPSRPVRAIASAGRVAGYLDEIEVCWDEAQPTGRGPVGRAIREGRTQIVNSLSRDDAAAPWRAHAGERGYRSCIALPLRVHREVIGAISFYAGEEDAFGPEDIEPLEELARNVASGIETLRTRRERDAAQGASRAKTQFLANMSHEIRTPLNAIIGLNYLMRLEATTAEQAERLDRIDSASRHLLSLINDVLDLSKIEAGGLDLEIADLQVGSVLHNVQSIVGAAASAKGITMVSSDETGGLWLRGDATRLQQALLNLASNAVKFSDRGTVRLRAQILAQDAEAVQLRFEVSDDGIGIDPAHMRRLFRPFEQADATITRRYGGSGLGLAITRRLVELMDGDVGAESQPGRGSTFWFSARMARGSVRELPAPPQQSAAEALRARRLRVLLAEDNEVNREVAAAMLAGAGVEVEAVADGLEAVQRARAGRYDLVLMDMQMPGLDGLQATRALRGLPGWSDRPIIALTANNFLEDRLACQSAGMNDFLSKPMDVARLYETLLRWAPRAAAEDAAG